MHAATIAGNLTAVKTLLKTGANPDARVSPGADVIGQSSLEAAVVHQKADIMKIFLESGAHPTPSDLFLAASNDDIDIIRAILDTGMDINTRFDDKHFINPWLRTFYTTSSDWTLLNQAIATNKPAVVRLLLERGANPEYTFGKEETNALFHAVWYARTDVLQEIVNGRVYLNRKSKEGDTALILALNLRFADKAKVLINDGADLNQKTKEGDTALILAVKGEKADVVQELINCGADLNQKDKKNYTALMTAVEEEKIDLVQALINGGADLNQKCGKRDNTALMLDVALQKTDIVQALIKSRANVNLQNTDGVTALMMAASSSKPDIDTVQALIKAGANVNLQDRDGYTVLDSVMHLKYADIVELLKRAGARGNIRANR